jgi:hypothetical protein
MSKRMPVDVCAHELCNRPIYKGEKVWKSGIDLYCKINCFLEQIKRERRK